MFICSYLSDGADIIANFKKDDFDIVKHRNVRLIHLSSEFDLKKVNEMLFDEVVLKLKVIGDGE